MKSPYIVEVYDSGRLEDGRPFIAMELLEGESLYDRMARVRLIDPRTTVHVISQVAKGLTKAHAANIVHRDLKPENIHLCNLEDGEEIAKILDFGLAKFYAPVKTDEKTARLTREGAVFGTPAYMSPEQVKGQGSVDHRADLWAARPYDVRSPDRQARVEHRAGRRDDVRRHRRRAAAGAEPHAPGPASGVRR